ncbi:alpha/beta fold hydrolase [candidate division KSB1 bacterium]
MKGIVQSLKVLMNIIKWVLIIGILLFSLATFMGKAYLQTFVLIIIAIVLAYWPAYFDKKLNKKASLISRILVIVILIAINIVFFKPEPKSSIYLSGTNKEKLMGIYDKNMADWPENTEDIFVLTDFGKVHILACGSKNNPPLLMIHAASMGAHSWAENINSLLNNFRIYSFDNIGEGNKSELNDALNFTKNGKEIADFYAKLADSLGVNYSPVFGASNGGFIAMNYAFYYPERVESLALFGPMGLTKLTNKSIMMLSIASMYPFQFIRNFVTKWALGDNEYVITKYSDWFNCIIKGTIPSIAKPVPMTTEQKRKMELPILLFLGTKDHIVGNAGFAKQTAEEFPNIQIEILESGHLIAVEHADFVNEAIKDFLNI